MLLLLLLLLLLQLLALPNLLLMLLLRRCKLRRLEHVSDETLTTRDCSSTLRCCNFPLLLLLPHIDLASCSTAHVHSIDSSKTHNTPHTLMQGMGCINTPRGFHAQHIVRTQTPTAPTHQLLLHCLHNTLSHRTVPEMMAPARRQATRKQTTNTAALLLVQPLTGGQTIQHQTPVDLFEFIVPMHTPKLTLCCHYGTNMMANHLRVSPVNHRRKLMHKILLVLGSQHVQRPQLQLSA